MNKIDAVFEGGGIKGIGLVGAVAVVEQSGYVFENVAGTSAGAIVASLVAAGYKANEVEQILKSLDYRKFKDVEFPSNVPVVGPFLSLLTKKGIFEGEFFRQWLKELLAKKGIHTFGDLVLEEFADDPRYRYKLQVVAADMTRGKMIVLPGDIDAYGMDPDKLDVSFAVRMSMSIPFFFKPVKILDSKGNVNYVVDGGVLSNYPVWLFDKKADPEFQTTFGFKLVEPSEGMPHRIKGPFSMLKALFATMLDAHDARYIADHKFARTIPIPTLGVHTTEFDLSAKKSAELYKSGKEAAKKFIKKWDKAYFDSTYRLPVPPSRSDRLFPQ